MKICPMCPRNASNGGYCQKHYMQMYRQKLLQSNTAAALPQPFLLLPTSPLPPVANPTLEDRIKNYVDKAEENLKLYLDLKMKAHSSNLRLVGNNTFNNDKFDVKDLKDPDEVALFAYLKQLKWMDPQEAVLALFKQFYQMQKQMSQLVLEMQAATNMVNRLKAQVKDLSEKE